MEHDHLIGKTVTYISKSGHQYPATITGIPSTPNHQYTHLPTVSLKFKAWRSDDKDKVIRKERVIPYDGRYYFTTQCYKIQE